MESALRAPNTMGRTGKYYTGAAEWACEHQAVRAVAHQFFRFLERARMLEVRDEQASIPFQDFADHEEVFLVFPNQQNSQWGAGSFGSCEHMVTRESEVRSLAAGKDGKWPSEPNFSRIGTRRSQSRNGISHPCQRGGRCP